jgi:hypothetical protein
MQPTPPERTGASPQVEESQPKRPRRAFWQGKIGPAFWTIASLLSLSINIILIVILLLAGRQIFSIKELISGQLIGGLYYNSLACKRSSHLIIGSCPGFPTPGPRQSFFLPASTGFAAG